MTTSSELFSPSVPYEQGLYARLEETEYTGLFVAAALESEAECPGALESAIGHVIRAWAKRDPDIVVVVISLTIEHLKADNLRRLSSLLEDNLGFKDRIQLRREGFFGDLKRIIKLKEKGYNIEFASLEIKEPTQPMAETEQAFKEYAVA